MRVPKAAIILVHAFVGWALCAATMGIGMAVTSVRTALFIHAVGAPLFFALVSLSYFKKFHYTAPFPTAIIFTGFVIVVDFFIMALLILKNLAMFSSLLGTWIPFGLIFASTYGTGLYAEKRLIREKGPREGGPDFSIMSEPGKNPSRGKAYE